MCFWPTTLDSSQGFNLEHTCRLCIFQRHGSLSNITHLTLTGDYKGHDDQTFGHCFFCIHCTDLDSPACFGWWPSDPDGGNFEGDEGRLQPDARERWDKAECVSIQADQANTIMSGLDDYPSQHSYQVLNYGGRSCLGFCEDVLKMVNLSVYYPFGQLTIAGDLKLRQPSITIQNGDNSEAESLLDAILEPSSLVTPNGIWNSKWYQQSRQ